MKNEVFTWNVLRKKLFRAFCAKKYFCDDHDIMIYQKDILDCLLFSLKHEEHALNSSDLIIIQEWQQNLAMGLFFDPTHVTILGQKKWGVEYIGVHWFYQKKLNFVQNYLPTFSKFGILQNGP